MSNDTAFEHAKCKGVDDFSRPDHLISRETQMFCKTLREFINKEVIPREDEFDDHWDWTERSEHTFVHDIWKRLLIDLEVQHTFVPPEFGGLGGGSTVESCAQVEEVARGDFALACSGFISPWSIASVTIPKVNEPLLKNLALASNCQLTVSNLGSDVVNRALDMMGSYGHSKEGKMEKLLRDMKITQIVVGGQHLRLTELARYFFGTVTV